MSSRNVTTKSLLITVLTLPAPRPNCSRWMCVIAFEISIACRPRSGAMMVISASLPLRQLDAGKRAEERKEAMIPDVLCQHTVASFYLCRVRTYVRDPSTSPPRRSGVQCGAQPHQRSPQEG